MYGTLTFWDCRSCRMIKLHINGGELRINDQRVAINDPDRSDLIEAVIKAETQFEKAVQPFIQREE